MGDGHIYDIRFFKEIMVQAGQNSTQYNSDLLVTDDTTKKEDSVFSTKLLEKLRFLKDMNTRWKDRYTSRVNVEGWHRTALRVSEGAVLPMSQIEGCL